MDLTRAVPIVIHGDDAECHRRRSFMVVTWGSVVVHASPWDSKLVVYAGDNSQCCAETYAVLDQWLIWSLVELLLGHYLDVDPWGNPFPNRDSAMHSLSLSLLHHALIYVGMRCKLLRWKIRAYCRWLAWCACIPQRGREVLTKSIWHGELCYEQEYLLRLPGLGLLLTFCYCASY